MELIPKENVELKTKQNVDYLVKGVIFGLQENKTNMEEIAQKILVPAMFKLKNSENSMARVPVITFSKNIILPPFIEINNRKYRVHPYVARPKRCYRCQQIWAP